MARAWREVTGGKVHVEDDSPSFGEHYMCGVGMDRVRDNMLPKKPKRNVCKNCLRVINKKK